MSRSGHKQVTFTTVKMLPVYNQIRAAISPVIVLTVLPKIGCVTQATILSGRCVGALSVILACSLGARVVTFAIHTIIAYWALAGVLPVGGVDAFGSIFAGVAMAQVDSFTVCSIIHALKLNT